MRRYIITTPTQIGPPEQYVITDPHRTVHPLQCDECAEVPTYIAKAVRDQCMFKLGCECGKYVLVAVLRGDTPLVNGAARSWLAAEWNKTLDAIGHGSDYADAGGTSETWEPTPPQAILDEIERLTAQNLLDPDPAPKPPETE